MAEYIEKEKLIENFQNKISTYDVVTHPMGYYVLSKIDDLIYNAPVVDVVPVVRCKDCNHYIAGFCTRDINGRTNMFRMSENDFCSYGERKTDNA